MPALIRMKPARRVTLNALQWPCAVTLRTRRFGGLRVAPDGVLSVEGHAVRLAPHVAFSCELSAGETLEIGVEHTQPVIVRAVASPWRKYRDDLAAAIFASPQRDWNIADACEWLCVPPTTVQRALLACNTSLTNLRGQQRLLRALELQESIGEARLADLASAVGFASEAELRRRFARHCSVPWTDFFGGVPASGDLSHLPRGFFADSAMAIDVDQTILTD
jgi:AraC-like DNA-binding protein